MALLGGIGAAVAPLNTIAPSQIQSQPWTQQYTYSPATNGYRPSIVPRCYGCREWKPVQDHRNDSIWRCDECARKEGVIW